MVIDIHTHTFPEKIAARTIDSLSHAAHLLPHTDATNQGLLSSMEKAGVDMSVVLPVATSARQVEKVNDASARLNLEFPGKLVSFGCMHPDHENWYEELGRIKELGLHGIKVHPVYQGVDIDDVRFLRIFDRAAQLGLAVITHAGLDIGFPGVVHCSPQMCRHVVEKVGEFRLILAHMGGWKNWEEVPQELAGTGVYLDTAFSTGVFHPMQDGYWREEETEMMNAEQFMELVRAFGADRILYGSDSPWSPQAEGLAFLRSLPLAAKELDMILGENVLPFLQQGNPY